MKIKSLKTRISLLIIVITFLVATLVGSLLYSKAMIEIENSLGVNLMNMAQVSTMLVNTAEHNSLRLGDENTTSYIEIRDVLRKARDKYGAVYVYTLRKKDENTATFVVDTDEDEPASIGEEYEMTESMKKAFNGTAAFDRDMYTDQWGTFKSGYAPIIDNAGKTIAVLGVDYNAGQVLAIKRNLLYRIIIPSMISIILCAGMGIWFTRKNVSEISNAGNQLKEMSHVVTGNIQSTNDIGGQITKAINQLSDNTTTQAASLESVLEQMQKLVQSINQIREHAQKSSDSSDKVVEVAKEGKNFLQFTGEKITAISTSMVSLNNVVSVLDKDSQQIEGIVEIIQGFAEQTKLLALNAAIEAARAGETGKGFAVVADEVGKLADNSGDAVKEINQLIMEVRNKVMETVELMKQTRFQVAEGTAAFTQTEGELEQIVSHARKAAELVQQIVDEIKHGKEVVQDVSRLIHNVTDAAQQNAAGSQNVSSAVEEQSANLETVVDLAKELNTISERLNIMT